MKLLPTLQRLGKPRTKRRESGRHWHRPLGRPLRIEPLEDRRLLAELWALSPGGTGWRYSATIRDTGAIHTNQNAVPAEYNFGSNHTEFWADHFTWCASEGCGVSVYEFSVGTLANTGSLSVGTPLSFMIEPEEGDLIGDWVQISLDASVVYQRVLEPSSLQGDYFVSYDYEGEAADLLRGACTITGTITGAEFGDSARKQLYARIGGTIQISGSATGRVSRPSDDHFTRFGAYVKSHLSVSSVARDFQAESLSWDIEHRHLYYGYNSTEDYPEETAIAFCWAAGPQWEDRLGEAAHEEVLPEITQGFHEASFDADILGAPPDDATHLLMMIDPENTVIEGDEDNNLFAAELPRPDLAPGFLGWSESPAGGVEFEYDVLSMYPFADTTVELFWAEGPTLQERIGGAVYSVPAEKETGFYGPIHVPQSTLGTRPAGATHLLLVVDPNDNVVEGNELSNLFVLTVPRPDLAPWFLDWSESPAGGVEFGYDVHDMFLFADTTVELFWAAGPTLQERIGNAVYSVPAEKETGAYGPIQVPLSTLGTRPEGATHLLLALDPNDTVVESDEENNVLAIDIPRPDLVADPLRWDWSLDDGVYLHYSVTGEDLPASTTIEIYWANGSTFDDRIGDAVFSMPTQTAVGAYGPIHAWLETPPPGATHLLSVVDPDDSVVESNEDNNVFASVPDLATWSFDWSESGVEFEYDVLDMPLFVDTTVGLFWAAGEDFENRIGGAVYSVPAEKDLGWYGPIQVPQSTLGTPPEGATHLLLVLDPNNTIVESDEENNVFPLALPPDIAVTSLEWNPTQGGVDVSFEITGAALPDDPTVALYWASGTTFADAIDPNAPIYPPISPQTAVGSYGPFLVSNSTLGFAPLGTTHLLLVVDPDGTIAESNEANNTLGVLLGPCPVGPLTTSHDNLPPDDPANIIPLLASRVAAFRTSVINEGGTFNVKQGYRSWERQQHFWEINRKFKALTEVDGIEGYVDANRPLLRLRQSPPPSQSALTCGPVVEQVNSEVLYHLLTPNRTTGRPAVNPPQVSLHTRNPAEAVDIEITGLSQQRRTDLAEAAGLSRPYYTGDPLHPGDHTHYQLGENAQVDLQGAITGSSPINILVEDAWGRRIGFDPLTGAAVNEIGGFAEYSGAGSQPQIVFLPLGDVISGDYSITGVGTGSGPYSIRVEISGEQGTSNSLFDEIIAAGVASAGQPIDSIDSVNFVQVALPRSAQVTGRHVFYNDSSFDGDDAALNRQDDNAIAADKQALLTAQAAAFANYTSYTRGINGIMVDIAGLPSADGPINPDDYFQFRVGNGDTPDHWVDAPTPSNASVRLDEGVGDSDRVTIAWDDNAIERQWIQVTVLANAHTGLVQPDVFYFGSAIGESGNSATDARVNAADALLARNNLRTLIDPAPIDFPYDYNRDGRVNATDMLIAQANQTIWPDALKLITVPGGNDKARMTSDETRGVTLSAWLYEWEQVGAQSRSSGRDGATGEDPDRLLIGEAE